VGGRLYNANVFFLIPAYVPLRIALFDDCVFFILKLVFSISTFYYFLVFSFITLRASEAAAQCIVIAPVCLCVCLLVGLLPR